MSATTDGRDGETLGEATVTFQSILNVMHVETKVPSTVLDGEAEIEIQLKSHDRAYFTGDINAALEHIHAAPGYDNRVDPHAVEEALGNGLVAVIETDERTIVATNSTFDASEVPSVSNPPVTAGDVVPDGHSPVEMLDHPTDGPLFRNPDGRKAQHEDYGLLIRE